MLDLGITSDGDFLFDSDIRDIETVEDDLYRSQMAMCRIKSIKRDWFIDNIGADLEAVLGMPNVPSTLNLCVSKLTSAITFDTLYTSEEVYIEPVVTNPVAYTFNVYLRTLDEKSSTLIIVDVDLVKGVNVNIGGL